MTSPQIADIQIQNTLSGKKEKFIPLKSGEVSIYGCGPTVYGFTHVGNARTAVSVDMLSRVFRLAGYTVRNARNITDIDDKIIKAANAAGKSWKEITEEYIAHYEAELVELGNSPASYVPKATENIEGMFAMIQGLIKKDLAYVAATPYGNDVYFRVEKFSDYGCLSHRKTEDMLAGTRIEPGESKESPLDFALWKAAKPGEPSWTSPWGEGRPGWHIECSAMIRNIFGDSIDIHMGGLDLIFPHHENEIAQSQGLTGAPLAKYWAHGGLLNFGREKMSKSLGNIFTTKKFIETYGGETLRLMFMQAHYRSPMDFSDEGIHRSEALLERLYDCKARILGAQNGGTSSEELPAELKDLNKQMMDSLFDDFNTARALGFVLKAIRTCYRENKASYWVALGAALPVLDSALGLLKRDPATAINELKKRRIARLGVSEERAKSVESRLSQREEARKAKNFAESDRLRQELEAEGIVVMDGADGAAWTVKV